MIIKVLKPKEVIIMTADPNMTVNGLIVKGGKVLDPNSGYARFPQGWKDRYGSPVNYPQPEESRSRETKDRVEITLSFSKRKMDALVEKQVARKAKRK